MNLNNLLTVRNPLGPFRQDYIIKRSWAMDRIGADEAAIHSDTAPNTLIYATKAFNDVFEEARPIIVGRRGSGKTSIIASLIAKSGQDSHYVHSTKRENDKDIYVFINSWTHLDQIVEKVGLDARHSLGGDPDWSSLLPETAARHWTRRIWMVIFDQVYRDCLHDSQMRKHLLKVVHFVEGKDVLTSSEEINDAVINRKFDESRQIVLSYLARNKAKCCVVIDSLEEYPVKAIRFQRLISGFLKCVNDLNADNDNIQVVCCIPEEIEPIFLSKSSNILKDFSPTASISRLRWRPIDLLKIVAERYREFLLLHAYQDEVGELVRLHKIDLNQRSGIREFFSFVMPKTIINRLGHPESSIAYVLRHTQLLPREFLMIFDAAILISHQQEKKWGHITGEAIVRAVEEQEPNLARMITTPFRMIYPELMTAAEEELPDLPPLCTTNDLDLVGSRFRKRCSHETEHPWNVLFNAGIIGFFEDRDTKSTKDNYEYGHFHYNAVRPITFASGRRYCVHPIFSGSWGLKRKLGENRCVYPADVEEIQW